MSNFVKSTNINGKVDVKENIYNSNKEEQVLYNTDLFPELKRFVKLNPTDIGAETVKGNISEVLKDIKLNESEVNNYSFLTEDILLIRRKDSIATLVNLNTQKKILDLPDRNSQDFKYIKYKDSLAIAFNLWSYHMLAFIKNGEVELISEKYSDININIANGVQFFVVKKSNNSSKVIYFDTKENCFKEGYSFNYVKNSSTPMKKGCLATKDNNLYLIETPNKEPKLIETFNSNITISSCIFNNFVIINTEDNKYLFDFDGNYVDMNICTIKDPKSWVLSNNINDNIIYTKNDGSKWFFDLETKQKTEIHFDLGEGSPIEKNLIINDDFKLTALNKIMEDNDLNNFFSTKEVKEFLETYFSGSKLESIHDMIDLDRNIIQNNKIFVRKKDNKVAFYFINENKLTPIFKENDEIQFFDAFIAGSLNGEFSIIAIGFVNTDFIFNPIYNVDSIINRADLFKSLKINELGRGIKTLDTDKMRLEIKRTYDIYFHEMLVKLYSLYHSLSK